MNTPLQSGGPVPAGEFEWPRDFDFREAYAEQRELLAAAPVEPTPATLSPESEGND
ncbi:MULTISPECIES: hypothetical protein [Pseudomonas]|jgi:hypothetical protein|uniref:hypothetical protein n=1 Tax=Pseudomonadaceae TaxID=135621 RepID=UPI0015B305C4|nr:MULTISPECIES: hypothetical protein [Pseudomonas]MCW1936446.1 hypothetical protein [Pseudomonas sp. MDMC_285]QTS84276.1 hypothetical protein JLK41_13015 [Pseudomonas khazarica]GIZ13504.1 hypothetical protein NCCP436_29200 [Pseudomonas sp. NCCP-436]